MRQLVSGSSIKSSLAVIAILIGVFCGASSPLQAQNATRLSQLDQLSASVLQGAAGSSGTLAQAVVTGAYNADLASLTSLPDEISSAQSSFIAELPPNPNTDASVAAAFDAYRNLVGDPNTAPTSPLALHMLRVAIAPIAPSLITKDQNGLPSVNLSPAEAVYFFDFLVAHGTVPLVGNNTSTPDTSGYFVAVATYMANASTAQRQSDISSIVAQYLLNTNDSSAYAIQHCACQGTM
jgi:hypothetical protein